MKKFLFNEIKREDLKIGDHIYTWRHGYLYAHHGIYARDGIVIHFTPAAGRELGTGTFIDRVIFSSSPSRRSESECPRCGDHPRNDGVISSCLECFLSGGKLYRFRYGASPGLFVAQVRGTCTFARSDPCKDVLLRAETLLNNGFGNYNLFKNNCEDFAIYCKTGYLYFRTGGIGRSGQAASFAAAASALASAPVRLMPTTGLAAVGWGIYCANRFFSDIGVRRDVMKIPADRLVSRNRLISV
ncbi:protein LEAD-SENSITIVE 1-like [Lycium ferocissimum]|uniref:protein LEAD-SENSITIVE 1-like n=1 Tax=Lycium ferocissimum TaxID=112874 RepID=UPI002814FCA5|nr:protein LEAD-SENSITIVE 1-like [Lycium ferocissimum]